MSLGEQITTFRWCVVLNFQGQTVQECCKLNVNSEGIQLHWSKQAEGASGFTVLQSDSEELFTYLLTHLLTYLLTYLGRVYIGMVTCTSY